MACHLLRRTGRPAVLTALVMVLAGIAAGATQATPAAANTNPNPYMSVAVDSVPGVLETDYAAWMCPGDQGLCTAYNNNTNLANWQSGEVLAGKVTLASEPTVAMDLHNGHASGNLPYEYVFWKGPAPGYQLVEAYWNGSWHGPIHLGMGPLASAPATPEIYGYGSSVEMVVAWKGTNGHLWYTHSTNPTSASSWSNPADRGFSVGSALSLVNANTGGELAVSAWWEGTGSAQDLWSGSVATDIPGSSYGPCDFGIGPLGTRPSALWIHADGDTTNGTPALTGDCPKLTSTNGGPVGWFGATGQYAICWGVTSGDGFDCSWWFTVTSGPSTGFNAYLTKPVRVTNMSLGSAPTVAAGPVGSSNEEGYWAGSANPFNPDLWMSSGIDTVPFPSRDTKVQLGAH